MEHTFPINLGSAPHDDQNSCRLSGALLPRRLAHVAGVLGSDLRQKRLQDGTLEMTFARSPDRIRDLTTLIAEESACCPFLGFTLQIARDGPDIRLTIEAPPEARALLEAFATAPSQERETP